VKVRYGANLGSSQYCEAQLTPLPGGNHHRNIQRKKRGRETTICAPSNLKEKKREATNWHSPPDLGIRSQNGKKEDNIQ